ncbi:MAG: histidine kinase [Saprospiraceae bacterium]|nr:histidine kinase [Saprospiraceae bacterium]
MLQNLFRTPFASGISKFYALTFCFIFQISGQCQNLHDVRFEYLGDDCGISNPSISSFQQDKFGFLWIGTGDGLNRYDGRNFKIFKNIVGDSTSLIEDFNQFLTVDQEGDLWVSYRGKGISKFDNNCQCFKNIYNIAEQNPELFNNGFIILRIDKDSIIWIGGTGNGLNMFDLKSRKIKHWDLPGVDKRYKGVEKGNANSIYKIYSEEGNLFWLATGIGLFTFDKSNQTFVHKSEDLIDTSRQRHDYLSSMVPEGKEGLWLSSYGGSIFYYDIEKKEFSKYKSKVLVGNKEIEYAIYSIQRKSNFELWVIIASRGIGIFNTVTKSFHFHDEHHLQDPNFHLNSVYMLYTIPDGVVFGAVPGGLIKYNPHSKIFNFKELKIQNSQYSNQFHFSRIIEYEQSLLFGTQFGNGLNVLNLENGELLNFPIDYQQVPGEKFMKVKDVVIDPDKRIWVIGNTDLYEYKYVEKRLDKIEKIFQKIEEDSGYVVSRIIKDTDGVMWALTHQGGIHIFNPIQKKMSLRLNHLHNEYNFPWKVINFVSGPKGKIWLGTSNGIFYFDKSKKLTISVENDVYKEFISKGYFSVATDTVGDLWITIIHEGLMHISYANDKFHVRVFNRENGLPASNVYSVCVDHLGILWFSTIKGIYTFNPEHRYIRNYTRSDGMDPDYFSVRFFPASNGSMYLAIPGKYSRVNYERLQRKADVPVVYIEKFTIQNREQLVPFSENLHYQLKPNENLFSVEFSCVNFENQNNHRFAYMLEGWDDNWVFSGTRRYASYSNLDGGHYKFKVKVDGGSGVWSEISTVSVFIDSPFYKKSWFIFSVVMFFTGLIFLLYRIRISQIEATEKIKTEFNRQLIESRMEALRAQMNPHFIFNSLNSINRYIIKSDVKTSSLYLTRFAKLMRLILDNSEQKKVLLANELEALKLYIEMEAFRFDHKFSYEVHVEADVDVDNVEIPPLIIQPYVENAIWHGLLPKESNGHLTIQVKMTDAHLVVVIDDNGIGRKKAGEFKSINSPTRKSLGMKLTEERLKMAKDHFNSGGSQEIIDKYDAMGNPCGTKVILTIPI